MNKSKNTLTSKIRHFAASKANDYWPNYRPGRYEHPLLLPLRRSQHSIRNIGMAMLFGCAVALLASCGTASVDREKADVASPVHFAGGRSDSGWIPFEYFNDAKIYVPVTINGHPVIALLDSGSTSSTIDSKLAAKIGIRSDGSIIGEGFGGSETMSTAQHVSITVGGMTIDSDVVIFDHEPLGKQVGHATPMMLGGQAFRNAVVDIDFVRRRLAFRDPSSFVAPANAQSLPLSGGDIRAVPMMADGQKLRMQFDLGNSGAALLYQGYWKSAGYPGERRTSTTATGGVGGLNVQKVMMLDEVRLGATIFRDVPITLQDGKGDLGDNQFDGNVGVGLLARFHVIVDFPHDRVFLAPPIDVTTPFRVNHTGLTLLREDDTMLVRHVAANSPAAKAGLQVNDRITAVAQGPARLPIVLSSPWTMLPVDQTLYLRLNDGHELTIVTGRYF